MSAIKDFRGILDIVARHTNRGEDSYLIAGAEHDIVYLNLAQAQVEEDSDEGRELIALGCHLSSGTGCWAVFC